MTEDREARRARVRGLVAGGVLVLAGLAGLGTGELLEARSFERFGTGAADAALDADGVELDATIMSSDPWEDGWIVSYEYYFGPTLEVGYQQIPPDRGRQLAFGDRVRIEAVPEPVEGARFPASSRLRGTVREPRAWLTRGLQGLRTPRRALGGLLVLAGVVVTGLRLRSGSP